jgi:hypothetical protein
MGIEVSEEEADTLLRQAGSEATKSRLEVSVGQVDIYFMVTLSQHKKYCFAMGQAKSILLTEAHPSTTLTIQTLSLTSS